MTGNRYAAFCAYVLLAASGWIVQLAFPPPRSAATSEIAALVLALCASFIFGGPWTPVSWRQAVRAVTAGVLLFGLPSALLGFRGGELPVFTRVSLLALVPAVVVLIATGSQGGGGPDFLGLLGASLAGVGGAFLLLPGDPELLLQRPLAAVIVSGVILSLAVGSYLGHVAANGWSMRTAAVLMLGPSLVLASVMSWPVHPSNLLPDLGEGVSAVASASEFLLLIYLVRIFPPVSLASRYLLAPLVTAVEGLAYVRPAISWRLLLGTLLLVFGSVRLLRREQVPDSPMSLL